MSKKEIYVCCEDCQLLEAEPVSFIHTAWIEGERYFSYASSEKIKKKG